MKSYYLKLNHEMLAYAVLQRTAIRRLDLMYSEIIEYDMALIRPWLSDEADAILDIGCGIAAIDARLYSLYPDADFYLLDKTSINAEYGTETQDAFYTSLRTAWKLMGNNGVPAKQIHLLEATDDCEIPTDVKVDLALSLFAWGWHFPLEAYAKETSRLVRPGGLLIIDVRNDEGRDELLKSFELECSLELFDGERRFYRRKNDSG